MALLRVGTRGSALALIQADLAAAALRSVSSDIEIEVVRIKTTGDKVTDKPFEAIGPKGIFAVELQRALVDGEIDVAVHSLKDLSADEPDGLELQAVLERSDPRDVLVARGNIGSLAKLRSGAVVGTSSSRRRAQLAVERADLVAVELRGNVDTRLAKIEAGDVDAAILAGAGLLRLGREGAITEWLDPLKFVPPPGQGAVVLETRSGELGWIKRAEHEATRAAVDAERTFMRAIEGGCEVPLGAWARYEDDVLVCTGFVSDGREYVRDEVRGHEAETLGAELARKMMAAGAAGLVARARAG